MSLILDTPQQDSHNRIQDRQKKNGMISLIINKLGQQIHPMVIKIKINTKVSENTALQTSIQIGL